MEETISTALEYQPPSAVPLMRNAIEAGNLVAQTAVTGAELTQKAIDAVQSPAIIGAPTKWFEFWSSSVQAVQASVSMMTTLSAQVMRSWFEMMQSKPQRT